MRKCYFLKLFLSKILKMNKFETGEKMKNLSFCLIMSLVIITMTISCAHITPVSELKTVSETEASTESSRRYPELKSAIIKYKVSGMNNGTETVYIDDWEDVRQDTKNLPRR